MPKKFYYEDDMFMNMQYYMEHCKFNGYVTPQDWLANHKGFRNQIEPKAIVPKQPRQNPLSNGSEGAIC